MREQKEMWNAECGMRNEEKKSYAKERKEGAKGRKEMRNFRFQISNFRLVAQVTMLLLTVAMLNGCALERAGRRINQPQPMAAPVMPVMPEANPLPQPDQRADGHQKDC
jgi:hypothetical protein